VTLEQAVAAADRPGVVRREDLGLLGQERRRTCSCSTTG
jgi:hypothetical protein